MPLDERPVRRVEALDDVPLLGWPASVPAVGQVLREGLDLAAGVTFLVGENGTGKSTLLEGVAGAFGLGLEGGQRQSLHRTYATESDLHERLRLVRGATILELGDWGVRETTWDDLVLVANWRAYLDDPHRYLRNVLGD